MPAPTDAQEVEMESTAASSASGQVHVQDPLAGSSASLQPASISDTIVLPGIATSSSVVTPLDGSALLPSTDTENVLVVLDQEAPDWVFSAVEFFEYHLEAGGKGWHRLVHSWQKFEMHMGYPESRVSSIDLSCSVAAMVMTQATLQKKQFHLPTALRPDEIAQWMKEGRDYEKLPELVDHVAFSAQWKTWWASLQPPTRRVDGSPTLLNRIAPTDNSEWEIIWRGGPCGLFLVIMGLAWWLYGASESDSSLQEVHDAIDDVHWALCTAMEAHGLNAKRAASENSDVESFTSVKRARID